MALLPLLFDEPFYPSYYSSRPSRMLDQHFGLSLQPEDIFQPLDLSRCLMRTPAGYVRNWRTNHSQRDIGSTITLDKDKFQASLDVQQFKPEEISVKITGDNVLIVEGKHEEKQDEHGFISRHFVRRYVVPKNCDVNQLASKLSSDGVLTITAPTVETMDVEHKHIPITQTGQPAKQQAVKNKNQ